MYFFKKRSKLFQERFFLLKHSLDETLAFHVETDQHKRTDDFQVAKEVYFRENPNIKTSSKSKYPTTPCPRPTTVQQ